jgi:hypothetical protein
MAFKTVFDADFKYRNADTTDVRLTFARIRREQRKAQERTERERVASKIVPIGSSPNTAQITKKWPFPEAAS